ncbi:MAG: polysaccharide deacetylase family protein [Terriglobia bacterium]
MKRRTPFLLLVLLPFGAWAQSVSLPTVTPWPQDRAAAVSLTFDDGLPTHLENAGPILKKHHLHGTFFVVTSSKTWTERADGWRRLAAEGNEIGSHTINHPCLLDDFKPNAKDYTAPMIRAELRDSARAITVRLEIHRGLTFAYPCCNMTFGPPADQARDQAVYLGMVAEYYFAARADNAGMPMNPPEMNPLTVTGLSRTVGVDGPGLLAMLPPIYRGHQWGVYTFHGIGGDGLTTSAEALDTLARHIEQHSEIWCATMGDAVRYILERKALAIRVKSSDSRQVEFALNWPLNAQTYDLPVTLQWQVPSDWTAYQCEADGRPLVSAKSFQSSPKVALVDVPPQTKVLRFEAE